MQLKGNFFQYALKRQKKNILNNSNELHLERKWLKILSMTYFLSYVPLFYF